MEKIRFQKNSDEMMRVISEQKKSLYLKAYVGSVYKDGVWRKMPEGQDPLQWFLTTSRTGNQMLYASAAVEAFREGNRYTRNDILETLNDLSSAFRVMMFMHLAGEYK